MLPCLPSTFNCFERQCNGSNDFMRNRGTKPSSPGHRHTTSPGCVQTLRHQSEPTCQAKISCQRSVYCVIALSQNNHCCKLSKFMFQSRKHLQDQHLRKLMQLTHQYSSKWLSCVSLELSCSCFVAARGKAMLFKILVLSDSLNALAEAISTSKPFLCHGTAMGLPTAA